MRKVPHLGLTALMAGLVAGLLMLGSIAQAADTGFQLPDDSSGGTPGSGGPAVNAETDDVNGPQGEVNGPVTHVMTVDVNTPPATYPDGCNDAGILNVSQFTYYWNFGLGVPSGAGITGVQVLLDDVYATHARDSSVDNNNRVFWRVWLSWDGGTTWTASKETPGNLPLDHYEIHNSADITLADPADLWGRTWSASDLSDANFRLRIQACTDAPDLAESSSGSTGVDAMVDSIQVKVLYETESTVTVYKDWVGIDGPAVLVGLDCGNDAIVTPSSAYADDGAPAVFKVSGTTSVYCQAIEEALPTAAVSTSGSCTFEFGDGGSCTIYNYPVIPSFCSSMTFDKLILGTDNADTLTGGGLRDLIYGLGGADTINGGAGNDCIVGGEANDRLNGGAGNDKILGEGGADTIKGDSGIDATNGGSGSDSCDAESETSCES